MQKNSGAIKQTGFIGSAENFLTLLDIPGDRILVVGNALTYWQRIFPDTRYLENFSFFFTKGQTFDLILYHSGTALFRSNLRSDLRILKNLIAPHGKILYFAENFYSPFIVKNIIKNKDLSGIKRLCRLPPSFHRFLEKASMPVVKIFDGLPAYDAPDELVIPGSKFLEIPIHANGLYRMAGRLNQYHLIANGRIYLISNHTLENSDIVQAIKRHIQAYLKAISCSCSVERLDIRSRGNLVIFTTEKNSCRSFISRLVSEPNARKIVRRNHQFLKILHSLPDIPSAVKKKFPEPIGELETVSNSLFTETIINGQLAWKANQESLREKIFDEASRFIGNLQISTQRSVLIVEDIIKNLFHDDIESIKKYNNELSNIMLDFVNQICNILAGSVFYLTISHGDYGYGNIMVNRYSGNLTGVIDWDTGRIEDFPGIDYLNLLIQKNRSDRGKSIEESFIDIFEKIIDTGNLDGKGFYAKNFGIIGKRAKIIFLACLIRFISRSTQYPNIYYSYQKDYITICNYLKKYN
ncbi:MAG: hypothetical protein C4548_09510 [Desulfobacteraceae bacterium]|nr:MAG: hypothetical protein C4548_09510 [Desulfobacteraceae bacterium]